MYCPSILRAQHIVGVHLCQISEGMSFLSPKLLKSLIPPASPERLLFELSNQHKLCIRLLAPQHFPYPKDKTRFIFQSLKVRSVVSRLTEASLKGGQKRLRLFKSTLRANTGRRLRLPLLASLTECYEFRMSRLLTLSQTQITILWLGEKNTYSIQCLVLCCYFF